MELLTPEGLRIDGRRPRELRRLEVEIGTLSSADGSATFTMGNTIVIAAVFGPHEVNRGPKAQANEAAVVNCEASVAPFSAGERRARGRGDRSVMELASLVKAALEQTILTELLPRTQIDVFVQVLQTDGGVRGCCINAALIALAHAGVPLRSLVAACTVGWIEGTPLLDLNFTEDSQRKPTLTLALQTNVDKVAVVQTDQRMKVEELESMMELAAHGCKAIAVFMRQQLLVHVKQVATARGLTTV